MLSKTITASLRGVDGELICVETDLARGLPTLNVVGLAGTMIREAGARIRAAITNSGYEYPMKRITINLSPAGNRKEGSHFDLPLAVGILAAQGAVNHEKLGDIAFFGELSLDGKVKGSRGILPLVSAVVESGMKKIVLPKENAGEAALVKGAILYGVRELSEVVLLLNSSGDSYIYKGKKNFKAEAKKEIQDYGEIVGQEGGKRGMMLCASGGHGVLMTGSPGAGKTLLAKGLVGILPPMSDEEKLAVTKVYSVAGRLSETLPYIGERPFRSPHHGITVAGLIGGGNPPRPGEFSLAHHGILFLDELPLFEGMVLDALREPMETDEVNLARQTGAVTFPGKVILVATANPCKCGYWGDPTRECTCSPGELSRYQNRLSGPLMDRIDLHMRINRVNYRAKGERLSSAQMREQVLGVRERQAYRYRGTGLFFNGQLAGGLIKEYCPLGTKEEELL
ncbi:MAG: YifB family Mg chelatase-like AAA ATPase, partial [Anaerovoracaceae bacterium]